MRTPEEIKTRVEELLSRMTLEEKIGQMVQSAGTDTTAIGGDVKTSPLEGLIAEGKIGSIIYMPDSAAMARRLQRIAVEKSRLGIPLIFCQDVIHGFQTIFPIPLGWSCSFDPDLVRRGHVYILQTPLFRVRNKKDIRYCYNTEERDAAVKTLKSGVQITRFKGLGEISDTEFREFIGENIRLDTVNINDEESIADLLEFYMGDNTIDRQNFIRQNLKSEEELDDINI